MMSYLVVPGLLTALQIHINSPNDFSYFKVLSAFNSLKMTDIFHLFLIELPLINGKHALQTHREKHTHV